MREAHILPPGVGPVVFMYSQCGPALVRIANSREVAILTISCSHTASVKAFDLRRTRNELHAADAMRMSRNYFSADIKVGAWRQNNEYYEAPAHCELASGIP